MKNYFLKIFLFLTCLFFLSSCATFREAPHPTHLVSWQKHKRQLMQVDHWSIAGSIGITYKGKTDIATFVWLQHGNNYIIRISSPMNLKSVRIVGTSNNVTLWLSKTKRITAATPEELLAAQFGWTLPITDLVYWIKAIPAPQYKKIIKLDSYNHLWQLQQQGWQIQYAKFVSVKTIDLPARIYLETSNLKIRLAIKKWTIF